MKKLAVLAATLFIATAAIGAELTETVDRTFDVRPGATVELSNVNGGITITSWDQPRVRVVARKRVEGAKSEVKDAMKELKVDIQPRNGGLVITTQYPEESRGIGSIFAFLAGDHISANVFYELTVPKTMNLDVENTNGMIQATGVNGHLELDTTNGRIEAIRCAGSIDAATTNGRIEAELLSVDRAKSHRLTTTNGRIVLKVPSNFAGEVDAATTNGSIKTDLPIATTRFGDDHLRGTINGGGAQLRLRTTNGGISIEKL